MTVLAQSDSHPTLPPLPSEVEIAIVGAGFSGLAMAAELKRSGRHDFLLLDRGAELGGTWRDNSYPGCCCDVPSHLYSFSFAPNPDWSHTFSPQEEIWDYLRDVARREGLLPHVRSSCEVEGAAWDDGAQRWRVRTSDGELRARTLIAAAGGLSEPKIPDVPGLLDFEGTLFHSASWDHDHDLEGERVAVVGTGASAIQFIPEIQPKVAGLHLFQRTPAWVMPHRSRPISRVERAAYRRLPAAQRLVRTLIYWGRELYAIPMLRPKLSRLLRRVGEHHLRRQIRDPELRARLTPRYEPGCKRILISNDYLPSLTRPDVEVLTEGIAEVRGRMVIGADGSEREVDTIILGTGFHVTDMPIGDRVRGRDGRTLAEVWRGSPRAHRGTTVAGFPNLFFLLGPNTGLGHNSVVYMAEAQTRYVRRALDHLRRTGMATVEPRAEAQAEWNEAIQRRMPGTVWMTGGCASWYIDENGMNTTLWPDFSYRFAAAVRRFDPAEHVLAPARAPIPAEPITTPRLDLTAI